jgi:hypothetical protein
VIAAAPAKAKRPNYYKHGFDLTAPGALVVTTEPSDTPEEARRAAEGIARMIDRELRARGVSC